MSKKNHKTSQDNKTASIKEIEIDLNIFATPIAIIIGAIIIAASISLSIVYSNNNNANSGDVAGILAAECDDSSPYSNGCLIKNAQEIGIDTEKFNQCLKEKPYDDKIQADLDYGQEINVNGTPAIFIGENLGQNKMKGFQTGPSIEPDQVDNLIQKIETDGIDAAVEYWKKIQLDNLDSYETQLRDYWKQQGLSGDALEKAIKSGKDNIPGLEQRKEQINTETKAQEISFGEGMLVGNEGAKTVLMEFSDYECPYCKQFAQTNLKQIKDKFVNDGKLLYIYRDFPLESIHQSARKLANAGRCADAQDKFIEMHDKIFDVNSEASENK